MTSLHIQHVGVVWIANTLWHDGRRAWRELETISHAADCTILALVYSRLRELRDEIAREAFTRQIPFGQVVAERREARRLALTRCRQTRQTSAVTQRNDTSATQDASAGVLVGSS